MDFIDTNLMIGLLSGVALNLLPFINRRIDKATSSYAGKVVFFIVEVFEAFEDGKVTKEEVRNAIARLETIMNQLETDKQYEENRLN